MTKRNNNFGFLHLLAALFVMYGHQCALLQLSPPVVLGTQIQALGVKIIFLISGYLITKSLLLQQNESFSKKFCIYAFKRLFRLFPELIFCLLFTVILIGPLFTDLSLLEYFSNSEIVTYITKNMCMYPYYSLPGVFITNPYPRAINGSLWTMPVEIFAYFIIFMFLNTTTNHDKAKIVYGLSTIGIVGLFLVRLAIFPFARLVIYGTDWLSALNIITYLLIGGAVCIWDIKRYLNLQVASIFFFIANAFSIDSLVIQELLCLLSLPYLVFSLALAEKQDLKLSYLHSEYSYGIYLWGFVIQQCLISIMYINGSINLFKNVNILFVFSTVITYVFAALSYNKIYLPFSKYRSALIQHIHNAL